MIIEVQPDPGQWTRIGSVAIDEPPGSLTSTATDGQHDVYVFGWYRDQGPAVWKSVAGVDPANDAVRTITTAGLDPVADLGTRPAIIPITGRAGTATIRFTYRRAKRLGGPTT